MPTLVVPFRGAQGKSRLAPGGAAGRAALSRAMLADVVAACSAVGPTFVVAPVGEAVADATAVPERRRRGQGAAVAAGLEAAVAAGAAAPVLVVNADVPCATPHDLLALAEAVPAGGLALVPATDGTTNALALASA